MSRYIINIFTILVLTTQTLMAGSPSVDVAESSGGHFLSQLAAMDFSRFGRIRKSFSGSKSEMIIFIEDAHANVEGQQNIARLIDLVSRPLGIDLVNVEGASGELFHQLLSVYPNERARRTVADYFLKKAMLTGPEFLAVTRRPDLTLYGVEEVALYEKHRQIYLKGLDRMEGGEAALSQLKRGLDALAPQIFSKQLRSLIEAREKYYHDAENFYDYLTLLKNTAKEYTINLDDYRELAIIFNHMEIKDPVHHKQLSLSNGVFDELELLEKYLTKQLIRNDQERELERLYRILQVMERLIRFSATRSEWAYFEGRRHDFRPSVFIRKIQALSNRYGIQFELFVNLQELERNLKLADGFYRMAEQRDHILAARAVARMKESGKQISILVAGGFHTSGIEVQLQKQGYSFAVISPHISKPFNQKSQLERYQNAVRYHASQREKMIYGASPGKNIYFTSPSHLAALSLLLNEGKANNLLRQQRIDPDDLWLLAEKDPQLGFNVSFTLLLQLEDFEENPLNDRTATLKKIRMNLPASLHPLIGTLYGKFLQSDLTVVRGGDPSTKFLLGKEFPPNKRFLISIDKTNHNVPVNPAGRWVDHAYQINGRRYQWGLADKAVVPVKRKTAIPFEDAYPTFMDGTSKSGDSKPLLRSEARMADTTLHKVDVNLPAYQKYLQPHLRAKTGRPLPEILERLAEKGILFKIFPFLKILDSPDHQTKQGVNVFRQMLDAAKFLWEYEAGEESPEYELIFKRIASTPEAREAAYLTSLLFDVGKLGPPAGHEKRGAKWLGPMFKKIGLSENVRQRSLWVIERHGFFGEIFLWHTLPTAIFSDLRDVPFSDRRKDLALLALINAVDTHAWYRERTPYTVMAANQYLDYIRSGYFDKLDFAEERFHAFSSRRSREGMIFDEKKYQDLKAELERLTKKAGKTRYNSFLENWGRKIEKLFYSVSIFEELDGTMLARTLFLLSQIMISASREQPVSQLGFTAPSRLARDTVGPLTKSVKSIPDRLLLTLDKHDFKQLAGILKKHDIELVPGWAEHRIAINNAKYLSQGAKRAEVRTFDTTDAALFRLQQEYESIRDLTILGGAFGEEKGGGAYFGLHKQKYLLKRAVGDPKWRTNGDPRFYFDAVSIYLGVEDAEETVKLLESLKGKSIPDYAFIFRTDEPVEHVRERLEKAQSARPGQHLVPFGVVIGNVAGTLSGSLWARRTFREYLEMLGYQWDSLKVKALLLAWGSGGRVFPMGQHNKILANSPISRESYLEENLRGILQFFQPKMKYSRQPGQNFVIYPDANKLIDREMNIGKHDFQFLGSLVNHDQQELNELGIANVSKEGILINFVEKPKDTTEIEMRLGPGVKFRSFGDVYGTDEFFDDLERRYGPYIKDPKLVVDFAMHLGEAVTVGNAPAVFGTHGLEESEWYEKKIDKLKDKNIKQALLTQARELASSFRIGTASGGFESRFIHSNNMEANYEMMLHLNGDPFIREFAKVKADSKGYIIGPNVILGKDVVVEPGAVILGNTIIQHGRIGAFAVVRDVWADKLIAEPRSLANMVDARDESLHIDSGFYANDVFIQHKSKIEKVRYVRRINEDINAPVHFSAIVLTIESLRNARGDVDSEVMHALVDILKATPPNRQPAEEGFENKSPVIALVSDDSLDEIKNIIFSFIPEEYLHRILIYSENGARATGFRPFTWMEIDYFRHSFPKLNKVKAKNRRALNKLGLPYYELSRNYPSFLSYNLFERPKDLFSAAHALQSAHPVYNIFISEKENLLNISLRDRKGVVLDLMNRFGISKRPHQRILIIGSDAGRLTHNGGRSLMRKDTRLTEIVKDPELEGRVYSLVVGSDAAELSSAVERPRGVSGSQATLEALKEVKRTIEQPVAHRAWKIIENRYSMQDIKQAYSRQAVERFDDERKREIQRIQKLQQSRSEFRHSILTEDHAAETGSLKVLNQAMGKAMEDTKISADRIVQWFSKTQRRANPSHGVSNAPSYFIADWDSRRLDLKDIEIAGNALSPKSTLILHVSDKERDSLRELINQNIVLKGGRRIVLSSLSPERIIDQLTQSPRYSLKSRDVYRVAVEPALLKEENLYRGVWHGARGFLQPGRILVLTSGRFEFPGAQSIHLDRHSLEGFVRALGIDEKVRAEIRRAA